MRYELSKLALAAVLVTACLSGLSVQAAAGEIGRFGDWTAYEDGSGANKICYMGSSPQKAEGNYTRRGPIFFLISHRPGDKVEGEVALETGYPFKKGSDASAVIDGTTTFNLFTQGESAWNSGADADRKMVAAMKKGRRMVVKGHSQRGTQTTDTYSLNGFTAAYDAISRACKSG
ncbi:MAG: invasion associated locus B family protein [Hyphomicrobiales bacterium]|nr:invasion associated locus B family protein [Hyphomicrobiales bacterium]